jgi:DNA-binding transcriptional LysR family regulator
VFRRLGAIEARLGVRLFERARSGYAPTPAGEEAAEAARRVEAEVLRVEQRIVGRDLSPAGTLRVTTTDTLLFGLLSPILTAFRAAHPDIVLEVAVSNALFSLSRREADVALRPGPNPPETLVGRRLGTIAQAVYARAGGDPATLGWIGPEEGMAYRALDRWMAERGHDDRCGWRVDSLLGVYAAVRDGAGRAVLPCYLADADPGLERLGAPIPALATELWLLTHEALRRTARVRVFLDFVAAAVAARGAALDGTGAPAPAD